MCVTIDTGEVGMAGDISVVARSPLTCLLKRAAIRANAAFIQLARRRLKRALFTLLRLLWVVPASFLLSSCTSAGTKAPDARDVNFSISADGVLRRDADRALGININYIRDSDVNRTRGARPLRTALRELGVRWLRYPGGEKSDFHLWSKPPYERARSSSFSAYAKFPGRRIDFDDFIFTARAIDAEPYVVLGFDSEKRTGRTKEEWLRDAVEWVRYSNIRRGYGVKYWEIGNENWNNNTATPEAMASVVAEFSSAMKRVDPSILVGASGSDAKWWSRFLPKASQFLDFVTLSLYTTGGWQSYKNWIRRPNTDLIEGARTALSSIDRFTAPSGRDRMELIVAETNAINWSKGGWKGDNTLGRSLVTFDTIGRLLAEPRIRATMLWGTRWMDDADAERNVFYALSPQNGILPTGQALGLWGHFLQSDLIKVAGGNSLVSAYGSRSRNGKTLVVWILNRTMDWVPGSSVSFSGELAYRTASVWHWTGDGPNDPHPVMRKGAVYDVRENRLELSPIPPLSVSVIEVRK